MIFSKDKKKVIDEINGKQLIEIKNAEKIVVEKEVIKNKEFYLPSFQSKQQIEKLFDVEILDVNILDCNRCKVNILQTGNNSYYSLNVV